MSDLGVGAVRAPAATGSTSESFQRSTPSAITKRRPIANVIALSAPAIVLGRALVGLVDLDARGAGRGLGHRAQLARRSAMRPWSSPWIR